MGLWSFNSLELCYQNSKNAHRLNYPKILFLPCILDMHIAQITYKLVHILRPDFLGGGATILPGNTTGYRRLEALKPVESL